MLNAASLFELGRIRRFLPHEQALLSLGGATFLTLAWRSSLGGWTTIETGAATAAYGIAILALRRRREFFEKLRLLASFGFVLWFYFAVGRIVPALGVSTWDDVLLRADRLIFGTTPAVYCQAITAPWLTDLLSACYLTFHVYLTVAVVHLLWRPLDAGIRLSVYLFTTHAVGLLGYLLVPARGPWKAFPDLFTTPLTGGPVTQFNACIVAQGSSVYDVFPSLHLLLTCILLDYDWREVRVRFWIMILPALGLIAATIYLRYHYAVDLIAGGLLFVLARWLAWRTGHVAGGRE
jgi:hypothetical protein